MKKTILLLTVCLTCFIMLISLCACPSNNTNDGDSISNDNNNPVVNPKPEPKPNPEPVTAYSKLTSDEKIFFDFFSKSISSFKSPESVRVQEAESYDNKSMYGVKVSATNSYGASISETYFFFAIGQIFKLKNIYVPAGKLITWEYIQEIGNASEILEVMNAVNNKQDNIEYNIKRINDALKEYKIEQGWIDD